jgi:hypothetical protein
MTIICISKMQLLCKVTLSQPRKTKSTSLSRANLQSRRMFPTRHSQRPCNQRQPLMQLLIIRLYLIQPVPRGTIACGPNTAQFHQWAVPRRLTALSKHGTSPCLQLSDHKTRITPKVRFRPQQNLLRPRYNRICRLLPRQTHIQNLRAPRL